MDKKWKLSAQAKKKILEYNKMWIDRILSCDPIDFEKTKDAVLGMYKAANLNTKINVVRCRSAMEGAIVCGWAAAYWDIKNKTSGDTTRAATDVATFDATRNATLDATDDATRAATNRATNGAIVDATFAVTYGATDVATRNATLDATDDATRNATLDATVFYSQAQSAVYDKLDKKYHKKVKKLADVYINHWYNYYDGGNEYGQYICYLSFVRDIVGFKCKEHQNYKFYEEAAISGGPRFSHSNFVILCDRPLYRKTINDGNTYRLHNTNGPSIEWKCGTKVWHINGVKVNEQIVMHPETQTINQIRDEKDEEVKAIRMERFGILRYVQETKSKEIDSGPNDIEGTYEALFESEDGNKFMLCTCTTGRVFALQVGADVEDLEQARNYLSNLGEYYSHPTRIVART